MLCFVIQTIQVNKIEVQYDKTSKQVDVQALKETLWGHMQKSTQSSVKVSEYLVIFFITSFYDIGCSLYYCNQTKYRRFLAILFLSSFFFLKFFMQNKHPPRAHHMSKALG